MALTFFHEPAWNNPVIRIVNADKINLTLCVNRDYSAAGLVKAMVDALRMTNREIPHYFKLLNQSFSTSDAKTAYLPMFCFWTGEKVIRELEGVVATNTGFMNRREVVEVKYQSSKITLTELVEQAKAQNCADQIYAESGKLKEALSPSAFHLDKEPKYYLSHTSFRQIPMTALQATKANILLADQKKVNHLFSPVQLKIHDAFLKDKSNKFPNLVNVPFAEAWERVSNVLNE